TRRSRLMLVTLRTLGLLVLLWLAANPGRWQTEGEQETPGYALLLDHSASMAVADAEEKPRWSSVVAAAQAWMKTSKHPERVALHPFAADLEPAVDSKTLTPDSPKADGAQSQIAKSLSQLLERAASENQRWAGVVVLSDGRETAATETTQQDAVNRARALGIKVHTLAVGGPVFRKDLALQVTRRQIVAYPGQAASVLVNVSNRGFGAVKPVVRVLDAAGKEVAQASTPLKANATASLTLPLPESAVEGEYTVRMDLWEGDEVPVNNEDRCRLRRLTSRSRVFLAEGAPYWDTKFLAQLLRGQGLMEVEAVYRLRQDRFYRVVSTDAQKLEETTKVFPADQTELGKYDLVVFGKSAECFLTPQRVEMLRSFVRDQGGAVLFSRGKPWAGDYQDLAFLEPGRWGEEAGAEYGFLPTAEGEEVGLFGERLPQPKDELWQKLPPLNDVRTLSELKPFTRVLAMGDRRGGGERVPLLLARRYGRGMAATLNGDGLWRWSFLPGKADAPERQKEFWLQLLQWAATYSEFLPGEDYSLKLNASTVAAGTPVRARIGQRGAAGGKPPSLELVLGNEVKHRVQATNLGGDDTSGMHWGALLSLKDPGAYTVRIQSPGGTAPSVPLTVLAPPRESDELSADPDYLQRLASETGGQSLNLSQWRTVLQTLEPDRVPLHLDDARWEPLWSRWWVLGLAVLFLGAEWGIRRRLGLA
ncbi:MAG: hypothetical protein ACAI34_19765, partial [Verrucomicrobium sp.]